MTRGTDDQALSLGRQNDRPSQVDNGDAGGEPDEMNPSFTLRDAQAFAAAGAGPDAGVVADR